MTFYQKMELFALRIAAYRLAAMGHVNLAKNLYNDLQRI